MSQENEVVEPTAVEATPFEPRFGKQGFEQLVARVIELERTLAVVLEDHEERLAALSSKNRTSSEKREMTADDARRIMIGDLRDTTTKGCMATLNLSYGQVYSCRKGFTFKPVHREMEEARLPNLWTK